VFQCSRPKHTAAPWKFFVTFVDQRFFNWNTGTLEHWNTGTLEHWNIPGFFLELFSLNTFDIYVNAHEPSSNSNAKWGVDAIVTEGT
jgi:hypothetical protein